MPSAIYLTHSDPPLRRNRFIFLIFCPLLVDLSKPPAYSGSFVTLRMKYLIYSTIIFRLISYIFSNKIFKLTHPFGVDIITPFYYQTHLSRCSNNNNNNQDNTLLPFFCGSQRNSTPSRTSGTDCISASARDTHHCIYFHSPGILHSHLYMYFLFALDIDDSEYTISFWDRV